MGLNAVCHPDRERYALDLCGPCYHRYYRQMRKALNRPTPSLYSRQQRRVLFDGR